MPEPEVLTRLRPQRERELLAAAGAGMLALAVYVIELRMTQWGLGPKFIVPAVVAGLILAMGWAAGPTGPETRSAQSLLLISGLLVLVLALIFLGEILAGHHGLGAGGIFWTLAVEAGVSAAAARRAGSAGCTLLAALFASASFVEFIVWVFHPHAVSTFRWILLLETLVLVAGALRLRGAYRRHGVQLVNVAGLLTLLLGLTLVGAAAIGIAESRLGTTFPIASIGSAGWGWKLYLLLATGALILFAVLDREPAPGVIGVAMALTFAVLVGLPTLTGGSLVFWPLFLLIVGGLGVAYALIAPPRSTGTAPPSGPPPPTGTAPPSGPPPPVTGAPPPPPTDPPAPEAQ
jgi:hypothetical protein